MRPTAFKTLILTVLIFIISFCSGTAWAAFSDIENNWAKEAITALEERDLFEGLWEDEFLPHEPLTHEDALELLSRAFGLEAADREDLAAWLAELFAAVPEGISRGEFAALLANVLGLEEHTNQPAGWYPSFVDLNADYPGFTAVEALQRLAVLPAHMLGRFEPYRLITRSEVAAILQAALELERLAGLVKEPKSENNELVLEHKEEGETTLSLLPETMYVSSLGLSGEFEIKAGEEISALARENKALLVKKAADQKAQAAFWGTVNNAAEVLAEILTPAQISAIIAGDWEQLNEEVRYELYQELVARGLTPWEAEALLEQDWPGIRAMAQERLTYEAADYLEVAPELIHAAISRDWPKLLEYAQVELAERILTSDWLKGMQNP